MTSMPLRSGARRHREELVTGGDDKVLSFQIQDREVVHSVAS